MLDAHELMLGNIVTRHFEGAKIGEEVEVTSRNIYDCQTNPTGKFHYEGVKITPDVLVKRLGFKEIKFGLSKGLFDEGEIVAYESLGNGWLVLTCSEDFKYYQITKKGDRWEQGTNTIGNGMKYIHEVQNRYLSLSGNILSVKK